MNVLRSLARDLWNVLDVAKTGVQGPDVGASTLNAARQKAVPAVLGLSRFRDGFEQFPQGAAGTLRTLHGERAFRLHVTPQTLQRDGFEGARRFPIDLSGGVQRGVHVTNDTPAAPRHSAPAFAASLGDLSALY